MSKISRLLFLLPLLAPAICGAQTMYKWTDENGRITYSDQPPVGKVKSSELISIPNAPPVGAVRQLSDQDSQFKKRQDDAQKAQADLVKRRAPAAGGGESSPRPAKKDCNCQPGDPLCSCL